jgi:hypothetical protein
MTDKLMGEKSSSKILENGGFTREYRKFVIESSKMLEHGGYLQ